MCSLKSSLLFAVCPSIFVSFSSATSKEERERMVKMAAPVALLFTLELICSNAAYIHSTVPFLQVMKESTVVWVYMLSVAVKMEDFTVPKFLIVVVIIIGTTMTIDGEAHFALAGFLFQGAAISCGSVKTVLQALLLSGPGQKLDAASYVLVVMLTCFVLLTVCCTLQMIGPWGNFQTVPTWMQIVQWYPQIGMSALVATALNYTIAELIRSTSAMGFVISGIVKDGSIVFSGCFFLGEAISLLQGIGFALQIVCVVAWSSLKLVPGSSFRRLEKGWFTFERISSYGATENHNAITLEATSP